MITAASIGLIAQAGAGATFSYNDIPNQLLRINSLEGSLAFSGAVLTGVTDVSPAGETVTVTGSPVYTASDAALNGAPSFAPPGVSIAGVNGSDIAFVAAVYRLNAAATSWLWDGNTSGRQCYVIRQSTGNLTSIFGATVVGAGDGSAGRKRALLPLDGVTPVVWNGATGGVIDENTVAVTAGIKIGCRYNDNTPSAAVAFWMPCSSVPSAPLLAALEAKLLADFG